MEFRKATRMKSKASIVIEGLSGTGKSGLALLIAAGLAGNMEDVYALDTENKSLDLFEGITLSTGEKCGQFNKMDITEGLLPSVYLEAREAAIEAGAKVFVQDSTSHAWVGKGGVLDVVNKLEAENSKMNKFNAWGQPVVSEEKNNLTSMIRDPRIHVVSTVRLKEKFELKPGEGVFSVGEQQIMQADMKYEPDLLLRMVEPGTPDGKAPKVRVMKTRYAFLRKDCEYEMTADLIKQLCDYLNEGADESVLIEQQRQGLITSISDILSSEKMKATQYKMWCKSHKLEDIKLADMTIVQLQEVYSLVSTH